MENEKQKGILLSNYLLKLPPIGEGNFGKVYMAKNLTTNKIFAAKVLDANSIMENPIKKEKFLRELKITGKLNHNNIIKLFDVKKTENNFYLFLEYCDGENLYDFLNNYINIFQKPPSNALIQFFAKQISSGLSYLYQKHTIHRDIKLENIMITFGHFDGEIEDSSNIHQLYNKDSTFINKMKIEESIYFGEKNTTEVNNEYFYYKKEYLISSEHFEQQIIKNSCIKLIDLGFARELDDYGNASSICGSPLTMAPEIWNVKLRDSVTDYNFKSDIWSFGCLLYYIVTGSPPFVSNTLMGVYDKLNEGKYTLLKNQHISIEFIDLLNGLLQYNHSDRFNWDEILSHPFLTKASDQLIKYTSHHSYLFNEDSPEEIILNSKRRENIIEKLCSHQTKKNKNVSINYSYMLESLKKKEINLDGNNAQENYKEESNNLSESNISDSYLDKLFLDEFVIVEMFIDIDPKFCIDEFIVVNYSDHKIIK